jgi:hypothetical protein
MKRKHGPPASRSTRFSARLRTEDDGETLGSRFVEIEDSDGSEGEVQEDQNSTTVKPFPLLNLPRELRNRIYDFHLEETCETSRLRNWVGIRYSFINQEQRDEDTFEAIEKPTRRGFEGHFYEPVFQCRLESQPIHYLSWPNYQAREHPVPALTLTDESVVAKEAWSYYTDRLMVHVDALNRFRTWCQETLRPDRYAALRKLYIMSTAVYGPPPDTLRTGGITDEGYPIFLIQISPDRKSITVSSRFELTFPDANGILNANLDVLMKRRLKHSSELGGEDVVEAMFAMHNVRAREGRQDLVIGPFKKGTVHWNFNVGKAALDKVSRVDKSESQVLVEAALRVKRFEHVLWRGEVG